MSQRRKRRSSFGALSGKRCPRIGTRVQFDPNPASRMLYSSRHALPRNGEVGTVTTVPGMPRYGACLGGPGGGLIFVKWPSIGTRGISRFDLSKVKG